MLFLTRHLGDRTMFANQRFVLRVVAIIYGLDREGAVVEWTDRESNDKRVITLRGHRVLHELQPGLGIHVCVQEILTKDQVSIGIEAPKSVDIQREEVLSRQAGADAAATRAA